jgi:hypothetical protein
MYMFRNIIFSIILVFPFISCSIENEEEKVESSLIGTWQLVQTFEYTEAGPGNWIGVEDGYTYTFSQNGEFYSTRFEECTSGMFSIDSNLLTMEYGCNEFATGIEDPEGVFMEDFIFVDGELLMNPAYQNTIEGFITKFKKVSN